MAITFFMATMASAMILLAVGPYALGMTDIKTFVVISGVLIAATGIAILVEVISRKARRTAAAPMNQRIASIDAAADRRKRFAGANDRKAGGDEGIVYIEPFTPPPARASAHVTGIDDAYSGSDTSSGSDGGGGGGGD